ncbi:MAG TPA: NAD-dependent epimerase/dehydratase family protein [Baekduia sp.]|uniref:NAD-dependent epimerase/dehydratase family protein n=1 Tax=Baekduia sp. TaxID=2600305 RepID=UPI002D77B905|nr:NAD-dependent epimerase/dehydratase family protein [Baekduia sp.]HET6509365.1 NAD-dependent epimerase/dehydratase family protein [Baekduia sp.]
MRLLVLGGTTFAGRAVVEAAVARGWAVTTFNRGRGAWTHPEVERIVGDRLDPTTFAPLARGTWDAVVDTWQGAPAATEAIAAVLAGRVERYAYVSSCSVYAPPPRPGADEHAPLVDGAGDGYGDLKRGSEIAVEAAFGADRALLLRLGLLLGPHEDVGRLPYWLTRLAAGGDVIAPGPPDLPLQLVDARDLAAFALDGIAAGLSGPYNVVSRRGHATMRTLLERARDVTGGGARLVWTPPEEVEGEPWNEVPIWLPPDHESAALHDIGVEKAHAAGLTTRPVAETVADTWAWLSAAGSPS